jgi:uncharacterized protein YaaN involved in tellurite resistance
MTTETAPQEKEVNLMQTPTTTKPKVKKEVQDAANKHIKALTEFDFDDIDKQVEVEGAVGSIGAALQEEVSHKSALLSTTVGELGEHTESGDLAASLISLREQVEAVNPNKFDFAPGFFTRVLGKFLPKALAKPMKDYMTKFRTAESVIGEIVKGIEEGQNMLKRDNVTLQQRVVELRKLDKRMQQAVQIAEIMDKDLEQIIAAETDPEKKKFFEQKVLVKLRTRTVDLQTVRAVAQQGIMSMDLTVSTNDQLIQNADRTRTVTVTALKIAVELRKALTNQKKMLEVVNSVNSTTNDLIVGNSELLKDNALKITQGAMEATLNINDLKTAFNNIYSAIDETENYKKQALPKLKETIKEFNSLSGEAEKKIQSMEKAKKIESKGALDLSLEV